MKKKIIGIAIVGMFLLMASATASTIETETDENKTSNSMMGIDLEIEVKNVKPVFLFPILRVDYKGCEAEIFITNVGSASLIRSENDDLWVKYTSTDKFGKEHTTNHNIWGYIFFKDLEQLESGQEISYKYIWIHDPEYEFYCPPDSELTVTVNPDELIPEDSYGNNYWEGKSPDVKSRSHNVKNNILLNLLENLPIFRLLKSL